MLTYREKDNFIYKLHPYTVMAFVLAVFILSIIFSHPLHLLALLLAVGLVLLAAGSVQEWKGYIRFSLTLMIVIMLVNAIFARSGSAVLYSSPSVPLIGPVKISLEALAFGVGMSLRLLIITSIFCLYTCVVNPDKVTRLLGGLGHKSVLIISLSTRLFPLIVKDYRRISEIQRCRGVRLDTGKWWQRVRKMLPMASILLLSSMERSLQMAESMYARGYGSGVRTNYQRELWHPRDYLVMLMTALGLVLGLWSVFEGWSGYKYYPVLERFNFSQIASALATGIILMFPALLNWGWKRYPILRSRI